MKNWRGKRILGLFLSVALVLSTLDVSTLTVTAKEGTISDSTVSSEEAEIAENDSTVSVEETVATEADTEVSNDEAEAVETEDTVVSEAAETENAEADEETVETESTEVCEETEQTEAESTEVSEETETAETVESTEEVENDAVEVSEEAETVEVESSVEVEETAEVESAVESEEIKESSDDEVECDGDVSTPKITINTQPQDTSVYYNYSSGSAPQFTVAVTVTGADSYTCQWYMAPVTNGIIGNYVAVENGSKLTCTVETGLNAGEYKYKCVISAGDEEVTVTSKAATLTVNQIAPAFGDDKPTITGVYGQTLSEMTLTTPTSTNGATGVWKIETVGASTTYPEVGSSTGYTVSFTPDSSNYTKYSTTVFPDVTPKEITVTIASDLEKTYGDKNPKITYTYSNSELVGDDEFSNLGIDFKTDALETSGVGEYPVTGKATNPNYKVTVVDGKITVNPKPVTVKAADKTKKYLEELPELTFTYSDADLVGSDTYKVWGITLETSATKDSDVGEYSIWGSASDTCTNYEVTVETGTFTITQLDTTFTEKELKDLAVAGTYGETLEEMVQNITGAPTESGNAGAGTWGVTEEEAEEYPTVNGTKEYTIVFTPTDTNYAEYSMTVVPTVTPKAVTATVQDETRAYREENPEFTLTFEDGALVGEDDISDFEIEFTATATVESAVGTYSVSATATNENYEVTVTAGTLTIEKADVIFAEGDVPSITGTYGDTLEAMKISGPATSQNGAEGTWELADTVTDEEKQSYPTVTGETEYAVVFSLTDTENYNAYSTTVIPTVTPKAIEIQVENKEKVYGEENPDFTFTYSADDLVGEDTVDDLAVTLITEATATSGVTEEGYPITGTSESDNYAVTIVPGILTITPKEITVQADNKEKAYGEEIPELTFTHNADDLVGEDTADDLAVILTTEATATSDVTEEGYPITGTSTSTNYAVTVTPGVLTIVKADIVFAEEDVVTIVGTYGQTLAEMQVNGPATSQNGAAGTWSLDLDKIADEDETKLLTVGTEEAYNVIFTPEDTVNYNVYPNADTQEAVTAITEVLPKEVTVQADDKTKVYGEENPELTFTYNAEDLVGTDTVDDLAVTLTTTATKDSVGRRGGYPITGTSESVNYAVTVLQGILTITQAEATITIAEGKDSYEKSYGGADFALEGITTNSDGAFVYTLSGGMDADGQAKAEEEIITVSESGVVTIVGSGSVIITVTTEETLNFKAAEPKQIKIQVVKREGFFIKEIPELTYTGKAQQPEPEVYDGVTEKKLEKGVDYTLSYKNSINAYTLNVGDVGFSASKAPQIIIKGKGNYNKKVIVYYTIQPRNIADMNVLTNDIAVVANGKVQTKVPVITYNNKKLSGVKKASKGQTSTKGKDFIYSYPALRAAETKESAFKEKGTYRIVVEGTGNYTGTRFVKLTITDEGMTIEAAIIEKIPDQPYQNGDAITLDKTELVVTAESEGEVVELQKNKDYTVSYRNNIEVGTATVVVTGMGKYAGTQTANFKIVGKSLKDVNISGLRDKVYNGKAQTQALVLTTASSGGEEVTYLTQGKDYRLIYKNNTNVGTAEVTIEGKGAYTGTIKKKFKITAYDISYDTDSEGDTKDGSGFTETNGLLEKKDGELSVKYTKGGGKPQIQFIFNGKELVEGKDYTATYKNNKVITEAGTSKLPVVIIKGKGNFKGSFQKTYVIVSRSLGDSDVPVTMTVADKAVSGKAGGYISKPVLTDADGKVLKVGKDYSQPVYSVDGRNLDKSSTVSAGKVVTVTVTGMGAYTGEALTATYRITNKSFNSAKIKTIQKVYTGEEIILTAEDFLNEDGTSKITFGKNKEALVLGKDFEIVEGSYKNNLKKGTASVTLRGLGEYGGTKTIKFKISAKGLFRG